MEARLPKALSGFPEARQVDFTGLLAKWQRQYVGVARGGRRLIYGNYFTINHEDDVGEWHSRPMVICDGGPSSFGAEYDFAAKRITRIDFNGDFGSRQEATSRLPPREDIPEQRLAP